MDHRAFETVDDLLRWLADNHATARELWVRIFKSGSGKLTVTWDDCVIAAITWGWIDGQKKPFDEVSYLQRLSPRKPKSNWSKRNRTHAESLIASGKMTDAGLHQVTEAKADGRWEAAYSGQADMEIPQDFLDALEQLPAAKAFYATLNRTNLFSIYHRLATAKKPQTRADRMQKILAQLDRGERFH